MVMVVSLTKREFWNVMNVVDNNAKACRIYCSIVSLLASILIRAPWYSLTPRSHNLSGSLPKVTVLSVTPMYDTVAIHYLPSSSGWVRDIVIPHKKYTGNTWTCSYSFYGEIYYNSPSRLLNLDWTVPATRVRCSLMVSFQFSLYHSISYSSPAIRDTLF